MGQITLESNIGKYLYRVCSSDPEINTVVEIGTWDGLGSTACIVEGFKRSKKSNINFVSLESNKFFYDGAVKTWGERALPSWVKLLYGKVIQKTDLDTTNLSSEEVGWLSTDLQAYESCPMILDQIPEKIDMLVLDGGEFSTKAEFLALESRANLFVLDDTLVRKCKWIRQYMLDNPTKYQTLFDIPNERHGVFAAKKL